MVTTFLQVKNNAVSTLAADISDVATSVTVASGEGAKFPSAYPFHISIDDEIMSCTNRVVDVLTVVRAQQSTTGAIHSSGASVALNITAKSISDLNTAVNTLESSALLIDSSQNVSIGDNNITNVGDIALDSITGDADADTNITFAGSDVITIDTGGTEALRIDSNQNTLIANGNGLVVGHTAQVTTFNTPEFQVLGTGSSDSNAVLGRFSNDSSGASFQFVKSRNGTIGSSTIVQDNDNIGTIYGMVSDASDLATVAAQVVFEVDDSSPAASQIGGAVVVSTATTGGSVTEAVRIDSSQDIQVPNGNVYIGDTANSNMTVGLTINQGANDNEILALKSSDVAHPMTGVTEADTFFYIGKSEAGAGGAQLRGLKDADGGPESALLLRGTLGETADTTDTSTSRGVVEYNAEKTDGGTSTAALGATENAHVWFNAFTARMLLKGNGDMHITNTTLTALDGEDDIALVRVYQRESSNDIGIAMSKWDEGLKASRDDLIRTGVWSSEGDFTVQQRMNDLLGGAIWQMNTKHMTLAEEVKSLKAEIKALTEGR